MKRICTLTSLGLLLINLSFAQSWNLHRQFANFEPADMQFVDDNHGFLMGDSTANGVFITSVCKATQDGGQTWNHYPVNSSVNRAVKCWFINANEGFIGGRGAGGNSGMFMKTADGGITWTASYTFSERVYNIYFINASTGWVMGKNGLLQKTTDGGITWNPQAVTNEDGLCMRFFDASNGLFGCGGGELYRTTDGGITWLSTTSGTGDNLTAISIVNNDAWICGEAGALIHSSNLGQSWTVQSPTLNVDFSDVSFVDVNNGWVAGISGVMNSTVDGGTLYTNEISNSNFDIMALEMRNTSLGWFLDSNGDLYKFSNATGLAPNHSLEKVEVYPNPASDKIRITSESGKFNGVKLVDFTGKTVLHEKMIPGTEQEVQWKTLSAGAYLLVLESPEGSAFRKILIL